MIVRSGDGVAAEGRQNERPAFKLPADETEAIRLYSQTGASPFGSRECAEVPRDAGHVGGRRGRSCDADPNFLLGERTASVR